MSTDNKVSEPTQFVSVKFNGNYQEVMKFFEEKIQAFESKNVGKNIAYLKFESASLAEEIKFFEGTDVDTNYIQEVSFISEDAYINTSENAGGDFEIVEAHQDSKVETPSKPVVEMPKVDEMIFPSSTNVGGEAVNSVKNEEDDDVIAKAVVDSILASKSPLPESDPFAYITSKKYMSHFAMAATAMLFIMAIFD